MTKKQPKVDISFHRVKGGALLRKASGRYNVPPIQHNPCITTSLLSWRKATMNDTERLSRLRHDLSNPLSALLAETQLLLLNESKIDPETVASLREIEALAIRMRTMLREL